MLPWFKGDTASTLAGMMRHTWTPSSPAPEYVAALELAALVAAGQRDAWSLSELAARWGWSKSRAHRLVKRLDAGRRADEAERDDRGTIAGRSRDDRGTIAGRSRNEARDATETPAGRPDQRSREVTADLETIAGRSRDDRGTPAGRERNATRNARARPRLDQDQDQDPSSSSSRPGSAEEGARSLLSLTNQRTADRLAAHGVRTLEELRALSWSRARVIAYGSGGAPAVGSGNLLALLQRAGLDVRSLDSLPGAPSAAAAIGDEDAEASWRCVWLAISGGARPDAETREAIETYLGPLDELGRLPEREARALRDRWIPLYQSLRDRGALPSAASAGGGQ